jgi:hypothetical protein
VPTVPSIHRTVSIGPTVRISPTHADRPRRWLASLTTPPSPSPSSSLSSVANSERNGAASPPRKVCIVSWKALRPPPAGAGSSAAAGAAAAAAAARSASIAASCSAAIWAATRDASGGVGSRLPGAARRSTVSPALKLKSGCGATSYTGVTWGDRWVTLPREPESPPPTRAACGSAVSGAWWRGQRRRSGGAGEAAAAVAGQRRGSGGGAGEGQLEGGRSRASRLFPSRHVTTHSRWSWSTDSTTPTGGAAVPPLDLPTMKSPGQNS